MLDPNKNIEVRGQLEEMVRDTHRALVKMLDAAAHSGALSEEMKAPKNYLLAKAIFDIWCRKRQYSPLDTATKKEFGNLSHFI